MGKAPLSRAAAAILRLSVDGYDPLHDAPWYFWVVPFLHSSCLRRLKSLGLISSFKEPEYGDDIWTATLQGRAWVLLNDIEAAT